MKRTAETYLNVWRSWLGYSEANGKYKKIIDLYNRTLPLPRGYKVNYNDAWCDTTVSAAAIQSGMTDLIGRECGCEEHIKIFKDLGIWIEDGTITPKPGYIIVYNWNDTTQPNDGYSDHIGVVESVTGNQITCIEGNKNEAVARRTIPKGWGYIRGYAAPRYEDETEVPVDSTAPDTSSPSYPSNSKPSTKPPTIPTTPDSSNPPSPHNPTPPDSKPKQPTNPTPLNKTEKWTGTVTLTSGTLNIRTWPGVEHSTCTFSPLPNKTKVSVCDILPASDGSLWYYINYKGRYGFAHSAYIKQF